MKKNIIILVLMLIANTCFAAKWVNFFEKQYIDFDSLEPTHETDTISFWIKRYSDNKEKFMGKRFLFSINKMDISCKNKKARISETAVYGKKNKLIYNIEEKSNWDTIIPDTYADGYYRMFCLVPFKENPLLKH